MAGLKRRKIVRFGPRISGRVSARRFRKRVARNEMRRRRMRKR